MNLSPKTRAFLSGRARRAAEYGLAAVGVVAFASLAAHAGTDTTFSTTTTSLTNWTTGSLGKMSAVAAVAVGVVGTVLRFDWKLIAGGVGIGLAAATGPAIVAGLTSATF